MNRVFPAGAGPLRKYFVHQNFPSFKYSHSVEKSPFGALNL